MPMRFPYLKAAAGQAPESKNACIKSKYDSAESYIGSFMDFIRADPVIKSITAELSLIAQQKFSDVEKLIDVQQAPATTVRSNRTRRVFTSRIRSARSAGHEIPHFSRVFGKGSNRYQDMYDDFYEQVLVPLCSYIDERIDDADLLLYLLSRYQRECTWFESNSLNDLIEEAESNKLEEVLDHHLRSWLYREGIDYPFSTPKSPSGVALTSLSGPVRSRLRLKLKCTMEITATCATFRRVYGKPIDMRMIMVNRSVISWCLTSRRIFCRLRTISRATGRHAFWLVVPTYSQWS